MATSTDSNKLLKISEFSQRYTLNTKNIFVMGNANPPISLSTVCKMHMHQKEESPFIKTEIEVADITGETDSIMFQPFLQQILNLAEINRRLLIQRNQNGKFLRVLDKERLLLEWKNWKDEKLQDVFLDENEQRKFVENYEKGFENLEQSLKANLQYLLLLPEIYSIIFPPNEYFLLLSDPLSLNSRLVNGMNYEYQLKLVKLEDDIDVLNLQLHAQLNNKDSLVKNHLEKLYAQSAEFTVSDFEFSIVVKYSFEKSTARILKGELTFNEKLHDHLKYSINLLLETSPR